MALIRVTTVHTNLKYENLVTVTKSHVWEGQFLSGATLTKGIVLGNMYRPPRDNNDNFQAFYEELAPILKGFDKSNSEIVLAGDTNINLLKINENETYSEFFYKFMSHSIYP